jgi:hypothetical protein
VRHGRRAGELPRWLPTFRDAEHEFPYQQNIVLKSIFMTIELIRVELITVFDGQPRNIFL